MVEKLRYRIKNPFFVAALLFAIALCSGLVTVKDRNEFKSLVNMEELSSISGHVRSNPSKTSSGRFYLFKLNVESASCEERGITSSASGIISVLLDSAVVESILPGKLYSITGNAVLVENHEHITLYGRWSNNDDKPNTGFFVSDGATYHGPSSGFFGKVFHARALSRLVFKRLMYGWGKAGGFILALLSGSREYTDQAVAADFRKAGLSHILALSGMHLSFFAGLVGNSGKKILGKKYSFFLKLAGILFFVWFAGLSPSLFRALLCSLMILLSSVLFCKSIDFMAILSFVFLLHCIMIPSDIFSAAFILSYGALAGILLFGEFIEFFFRRIIPRQISSSLAASTGAQAMTAPFSLKLFGAFMPIGIIASVIMTPLVEWFLILSVVSIMLSFMIPLSSHFWGMLLNVFYGLICAIAGFFANFPAVSMKF